MPWPEDRKGLSVRELILRRNAKPIRKAADKLATFVGECVSDMDFRHAESQHLLAFLLLTRDVLTDRITEHWTLDDILEPISAEVRKQSTQNAAAARSDRFETIRRAVVAEWRSSPRKRGDKKRFGDAMATKYGVKADTVRKEWLSEKALAASE